MQLDDDSVADLKLHDFVTQESMKFFTITGISSSFLQMDPSEWSTDPGYMSGLQMVIHFKVVNDAAERAVQLTKRFLAGNQLTHDEEQRQLLLMVAAKDRQVSKLGKMKACKKS